MTLPTQKNTPALDFQLKNQDNETVTLSSYQNIQPVIIFFYPKNGTPGCIQEVCLFRESYPEFKKAGAEVMGISSDSIDSHQRFIQKHQLPFQLLSDKGGSVRKEWDVPNTLGFLPGRVTYIIDTQGLIRHQFSSPFNIKKHIQEALRILKSP